jgi:hypothetical protein
VIEMTAITLQTRTGRWVVERRPTVDRWRFVHDRTLRDLIDTLDEAIAIVNADNTYTPHQIELIDDVLRASLRYLSDVREQTR